MSALTGTALVTGASSGMGRAIALALSAAGMRVLCVGRDVARLAEVEAALPGRAGSRAVVADLSTDEGCAALAAAVEADGAVLDALVHAAGALVFGLLAEATAGQLDELYRVNLRAPFAITRALLPLLRAGQGQLVFVNSMAGLAAGARNGLYAATKHALASLTRSFRDELNAEGIRVLSLFPGRTATPMQQRVAALEGRPYVAEDLIQPEDVARLVVHALALPRSAEITDVMIRPRRPVGAH